MFPVTVCLLFEYDCWGQTTYWIDFHPDHIPDATPPALIWLVMTNMWCPLSPFSHLQSSFFLSLLLFELFACVIFIDVFFIAMTYSKFALSRTLQCVCDPSVRALYFEEER